jgi:TP901-1 family phage major tail protein
MSGSAVAGRLVRIKIGSTVVAGARSDSFSVNREHIDITDKGDAGVRKLLGLHLATMETSLSCSGVLKGTALIDWAKSETDVLKTLDFEVTAVGTYTGSFGLASFSIGAEHNGEATFEATFESGGAVTFTAA